jgi:hypothetical protein
MVHDISILSPSDIRNLRVHRLGEKRRTFARRFCRSARTVQSWEQGVRRPDKLCLRIMCDIVASLTLPKSNGLGKDGFHATSRNDLLRVAQG